MRGIEIGSEYPFYLEKGKTRKQYFMLRSTLDPYERTHFDVTVHPKHNTSLYKRWGHINKNVALWRRDKIMQVSAIIALKVAEEDKKLFVNEDFDILFIFIDCRGDITDLGDILLDEIPYYHSVWHLLWNGSRLALRIPQLDEFDMLTEDNSHGGVPTTYVAKLEDIIEAQEDTSGTPNVDNALSFIYLFDGIRWKVYEYVRGTVVKKEKKEYILTREIVDYRKRRKEELND